MRHPLCVEWMVQLAVTAIPAQNRVTLQILNHWQPFSALKQAFEDSRRAEQLRLRAQQRCYCRGLCPSDRDGQPRVSRGGCRQTYPLIQADELAGADQASS
jgi:hypothetical protein